MKRCVALPMAVTVLLSLLLSFSACGTKKNEAERDTESEQTYAAVLTAYKTAIEQNDSAEEMTEKNVNYLVSYLAAEGDALESVCYAFLDLDTDGQKELILFNNEDRGDSIASVILDLYDVYDGTVTSMLQSNERDCYYMGENNIIYNEASDGYDSSLWEKNTYENGMLCTVGSITYAESGDTPMWTYTEQGQEERSLSEEEALQFISAYQASYLCLNGTALSEWKA